MCLWHRRRRFPAPSVKATAVLNAAGTRSTSRHSLVRRSARNTASTHLIGNASLSMHRAVSRMRPSGRRLSTLKNVDGRATWLYVSASMNACAALSLLGSGSRSKLAGSSGFGGALNPRDSSSEEVSRSRDASNTFPRNPSPTASLTNDSARRACADVSGVPPSTRRRRPRSSCTEAGACRDGDAGGVPEARDGDAGAGDRSSDALAASEERTPSLAAASSTRAVSGPGAESGGAFSAVSKSAGDARVASPGASTASADAPMPHRPWTGGSVCALVAKVAVRVSQVREAFRNAPQS